MENNNIFEGAKFGDKFVTRDGKVAIYMLNKDGLYLLVPEDYYSFIAYRSNGREIEDEEHGIDIISRYQELHSECNNNSNGCVSSICPETCSKFIDEEKLDELATNWNINYAIHPTMVDNEDYYVGDIIEAFKYGYRKAKEE